MLINVETNYNINDEVYIIHNTNKYNDFLLHKNRMESSIS